MHQAFVLIESGDREKRTYWPYKVKAAIIREKLDGKSDREAIREVAERSGIHLKPSYIKDAGSHVYRFRKEIRRIIENPFHPDHADVVEICIALKIIKPVEQFGAETA